MMDHATKYIMMLIQLKSISSESEEVVTTLKLFDMQTSKAFFET
jgi:hypothetical protein